MAMGSSLRKDKTATTHRATVQVFWRAYEGLTPGERQDLAERILRDRKLLADTVDHCLIERAKRVKGKAVTLAEYEITSRRRAVG